MDLTVFDRFIESALTNPVKTDSELIESAVQKKEPTRIDKVLELGSYEDEYNNRVKFFADSLVETEDVKARTALKDFHFKELRALRYQIVKPYVDELKTDSTLIYGIPDGSDNILRSPDGSPRTVDLLIHHTHPVSAEDEFLREQRIAARTIYRFRVPPLDNADWMRLFNPVRVPMTPLEYRALLLRRFLTQPSDLF